METISINQFKQNLKRFIGRVIAEHSPIKVRSGDEEIVVVSAQDWESEREDLCILQDKELMRQLDESAKTHATGTGYRPTKEEMDEILSA